MTQPEQHDEGIGVSVDHLIALRDSISVTQKAGRQTTGLTRIPGQSRGRRHGAGVDFEDLRLYQHGDDVRHIDWNATARFQETYLKRYREERERLCVVVVDLRSSMAFGTRQRLKSVAASELAAAVAWLAASRGYRVGAVVAAPRSTEATRPRSAPRGTLDAVGLIARQHAALIRDWRNEPTDLDAAIHIMAHALAKGGRAVLVTGGDDPGDAYDSAAQQLAPEQQLFVYHVQDPLESESTPIPAGRYPFCSTSRTGRFTVGMKRNPALDRRRARHRQTVIDRYGAHYTPFSTVNSTTPAENVLAALADHDFL